MLQLVMLIVFPSLMVFAALSDLFTMTISNRVSIALVLVFVPFGVPRGLSPETIGLHLATGFGMLVLTFGMFAMGWVGGGDAKLAAATALWVGWNHVADYGLDAAALGGALTLLILLRPHAAAPDLGARGHLDLAPARPPDRHSLRHCSRDRGSDHLSGHGRMDGGRFRLAGRRRYRAAHRIFRVH